MKIKFAVLLTLLFAGLLTADEIASSKAGSLADLDARYGFRDLKFEQPIASCKNMVILEDGDDMKFYTRKDDVLEQGGTKLKPIEYGFYKGKLACVTLNVAPDADPAPLLKSLEADFGAGRKSPSKPGKFYWFGQKVLMDYWTGGIGRGTVGMWSKPLQAQQIADRKAGKK